MVWVFLPQPALQSGNVGALNAVTHAFQWVFFTSYLTFRVGFNADYFPIVYRSPGFLY